MALLIVVVEVDTNSDDPDTADEIGRLVAGSYAMLRDRVDKSDRPPVSFRSAAWA